MFLLYITRVATGYVQVVSFPTALDRALEMILLAGLPVTLRIPPVAIDHDDDLDPDDRDEDGGSRCGSACGHCGRCS